MPGLSPGFGNTPGCRLDWSKLMDVGVSPGSNRVKKLVGTGRFELPTCRLGGDRSIHLSYVPAFISILPAPLLALALAMILWPCLRSGFLFPWLLNRLGSRSWSRTALTAYNCVESILLLLQLLAQSRDLRCMIHNGISILS